MQRDELEDYENREDGVLGEVDPSQHVETVKEEKMESIPSTSSQDPEAVRYLYQELDEINLQLEHLIENMQTELEQLFAETLNAIIGEFQHLECNVKEGIEQVNVTIMERDHAASNLLQAENAIKSFYHSIENKK